MAKTTTALSIAHVLQRIGYVTGLATTECFTVASQSIKVGDCTGYWPARTVVTAPEAEFAVLETACGGILKRGLGFDQCNVGLVLNVHNDHLGEDGLEAMQDLTRVKALGVATARKAVVRNVEDALRVQLARRARVGHRGHLLRVRRCPSCNCEPPRAPGRARSTRKVAC